MAKSVNVYADYAFQFDLQIRDADTGELRDPVAAEITGLKLRLSLTRTGAAIDADVNNLALDELADDPTRFAYVMETAVMQEHLAPLGNGATFYAIVSKANDMDMEAVRFVVRLGALN